MFSLRSIGPHKACARPASLTAPYRRDASQLATRLDKCEELIHPLIKGPVVKKDVEPTPLLNLKPRRKDFEPTDGWPPVTPTKTRSPGRTGLSLNTSLYQSEECLASVLNHFDEKAIS